MDRPIQSREDGYHSNLEEAIAMIWDTSANWATPNTMDSLPPRSFDAMKRQARNGQRKNRKRPANLREQIEPEMQRAYDEARKEANWPTPTTQETPHEEMELTETGRRKTKDGKDSHSLNLQDVSANWPTPLASDENYRVPTENWKGTNDLPSVVSNWPTPKAGNPGSRKPGTGGKVLNEEAKKWPTPNASEHKYRMQGNTQQSNGLTATARKSDIHSTLQAPETGTDGHTCSPSCRRLNPLFAEHLMGLPLGWTCVSGPLETESFQRWQLALSAYLARN